MSLVLRPRGRRKPQQGFTLIEVMIALLLLLIGVAGVLSLQMVSVRATSFSRHATEATIVADQKMDELMTVITTNTTFFVSGTDNVDEMSRTDGSDIFTRTWTLTPDATPGVTHVRVVITWLERGTDLRTISIAGKRRL